MATYTGIDGEVTLLAPSGDLTAPTAPATTNTVGQVRSWTLNISQDLYDITAFGDTARQFKAGLQSWTASVEVDWDAATTSVNQDELWESIMSADFGGTLASSNQVQVNLYTDNTSSTGSKKAYYGAAFVERADVAARVGDTIRTTLQLRGNGVIKFTSSGS